MMDVSETDITLNPLQQSLPDVSVLLAVRNGMPYVEASIRSIMAQSLRSIEIILVDDASDDETPQILRQLAIEDSRVIVKSLPNNLGLTQALNEGLRLARGKYIARMDADDLCHPDRLQCQFDYMQRHARTVLCGTSCRYIDASGNILRVSHRARDAVMCRWLMRSRLPVIHPTFMFRRLLDDGTLVLYDPAYTVGQDHDLAVRLLKYGDVVCLPDVLLDFRLHSKSITSSKWVLQQKLAKQTVAGLLDSELPEPVIKDLIPFMDAFFGARMPEAALVFHGLRKMVKHDSAAVPTHARWFKRQAAQLALAALERAKLDKGQRAWTFVRYGADFVPALLLRFLEIKNLLPHVLRSDAMIDKNMLGEDTARV